MFYFFVSRIFKYTGGRPEVKKQGKIKISSQKKAIDFVYYVNLSNVDDTAGFTIHIRITKEIIPMCLK